MEASPELSPLLQRIDDRMLARLAPDRVRVRALDLFLLGRVRHRLVSGNRLLAEVTGSRDTYRTTVHVLAAPDDPDAIAQCECPRRPGTGLCKHAVAVLYAWIHEPWSFESLDRRVERLAARPRAELLALIRRLLELEPAMLGEVDEALSEVPVTEVAGDGTGTGEAPAPGRIPLERWLRRLEEEPDPDPGELERLARDLEGGSSGRTGAPDALGALLAAALWRQAGLARLAAARGEDRTRSFVLERWRRLLPLLLETLGPRQALPAIVATARIAGPGAQREAAGALLEAGCAGAALALARQALAAETAPEAVAAARQLVARALLALGRPGEAVPYLAANFTQHPDAGTLELLEEAATAAGRWPEIEGAVRERLATPGCEGLRVEYLLRRRELAELARALADPEVRGRVTGRLLLESADALRREDPGLARALYDEVIRRGEAGPDDPGMRARLAALAHRLQDGGSATPPGSPGN